MRVVDMRKWIILIAVVLSLASSVLAADYIPTGAKDFTVYADQAADLDGYVYSSVTINASQYPGETFECITMIFANQSGQYIHVQSNPPHINPTNLGIFSPNKESQVSPEALGYFPVHNGLANIYYRSKDIIAYNEFLYVIKCNSNDSQLTYEETLRPNYREFGKELPSRGVWFAMSENSGTIVFVGTIILLLIMFIYFKFSR
jgi:hypothetical protein